MIVLTRFSSERIAINADLVARVETNPDTRVTLIDGSRYIVTEPMEVVIRLVEDVYKRQAQDILDIGAYKKGTDPLVDASLEHQGAIDAFLQQVMTDRTPAEESWARLTRLTQVLAGGED